MCIKRLFTSLHHMLKGYYILYTYILKKGGKTMLDLWVLCVIAACDE